MAPGRAWSSVVEWSFYPLPNPIAVASIPEAMASFTHTRHAASFSEHIRFVIPVPVGSELRDPLGLFDGRRGHLPASLCGCALAELK